MDHYMLGQQSLSPDLSLIRDYSWELQALEPYRGAFIAHFYQDNQHLYYVAAMHERGPDSGTFQSIRAAMELAKPKIVIIEGLETSHGLSPIFYQERATTYADTNFIHCEEPYYAAYQAMQAAIPFIGGEPNDSDIFVHMQKRGYSCKDVAAFYTLRKVPRCVSYGLLTEANMNEFLQRQLDCLPYYAAHATPANEQLSLSEFYAWYASHNTAGRTLLQLESGHMAPLRNANASYFERMNADINDIRERHLDTLISDMMNGYGCIVTVYGGGHLVQSRKLFEHMFSHVEHMQPVAT